MSESLKRGYSEFPERREKIRNKALGRKMPKDTRCKISLNHSKSNLLKINDEVGSIRYWALKIGKAHSVLSYRLKDNRICYYILVQRCGLQSRKQGSRISWRILIR